MIVIPMAGLSRRFTRAGYDKPKFMLPVEKGLNLFQASLLSFEKYFTEDQFMFLFSNQTVNGDLILKWANQVGLKDCHIKLVGLNQTTRGQAETVYKGLEKIDCAYDDELLIFNIDTIYKDFVKFPSKTNYLDVTKMPGNHWSFVLPNKNQKNIASKVVEKCRISNLCSVGLYGFESINFYKKLFLDHLQKAKDQSELYVAPLYQDIIDGSGLVHFREIEKKRLKFLGTPDEYRQNIITSHSKKRKFAKRI